MFPKLIKTFHLQTAYSNERNAHLWLTQYHDGGWALLVTDAHKEQILVATVNLDQPLTSPEHVFIKDWSENAGILVNLVTEGVITPPLRSVSSGYVQAQEVKLLIDVDDIWNT